MARTKEDIVATKTDGSPRVAKSAGGVTKDSDTPVKRGRGRPRSANPKVYVPSGRPRGRPKGSTKAASAAKRAALGEAVGLDTKPNTRAAGAASDTGKRGRGRPRKSVDAEPVAEPKKRGRRPKKAAESPAAEDDDDAAGEEDEELGPVGSAEEHDEDDSDKDLPAVVSKDPNNEEELDQDISD